MKQNKQPIIGQEAVVPTYGLGRIVSFEDFYIEVRPYSANYAMKFDPNNVKLVKVNFEEGGLQDKKDYEKLIQELLQLDYGALIELADTLEDEIAKRDYEEDYKEEEV